ncbi:dipeptide epimerase [Spirulina subsalsa]|uniref:dipeptide epimerase n=1 Tax=Spirulina subsalsa TaxID=54311 RepID=UPI0002EB0150|nr:dipeptide epimerase [Spirulina subsalsa]
MQIQVQQFTVHKKVPLTISRGTQGENTNLWIQIEEEGITGWGESTPFSVAVGDKITAQRLAEQVEGLIPYLSPFAPWEWQHLEGVFRQFKPHPAVQAGIDLACHDWLGKRANLPLWQMWGADLSRVVPTSVTVGISSPELARQRVRQWREVTETRAIKVKLGSPEGIEADRAMLQGVREEAPEAELTVDANGGWTLGEALEMMPLLVALGVRHLEQPLGVEDEGNYGALYERALLPIFVDESCFTSGDVARLAGVVHGINIKLMKSGGLREAWRMIHLARGLGLQVMYGCYSDSCLANSAIAQLGAFADYLDLDSHLNLQDDPFTGAVLQAGRLIPTPQPGLGVQLKCS